MRMTQSNLRGTWGDSNVLAAAGYLAAEGLFYLVGRLRHRLLSRLPTAEDAPDPSRVAVHYERFLELRDVFCVKEFLRGWFLGVEPEAVLRGNVEEFVAYGFHCKLPHQLGEADRAAVMAFVDQVEGAWGVRFTPGYDPELRFMAHLWEPLRAYHKPLFMFLLTEAAARAAQLLLLLMGFRPGRQGRFTYWHVRPPGALADSTPLSPLSPLSPKPVSPPAPRGRSLRPNLRRRSTAGEAMGAALHHAAGAVHHAAEHALDDIVAVTSSAAAVVAAQHPHGPSPLSPRALSPLPVSPRTASSLDNCSLPAELPARLASAPAAVPAAPAADSAPAAAEGESAPRRRVKGDSAAEFAAAGGSLGAAAAAATAAAVAAAPAEAGVEAPSPGALMAEPPASPFRSLAVQLPSDSAAALGGSAAGLSVPSGPSRHSTRPDVPIVFLHGVGFGTLPYLALIRGIQHACPDTPLLMVEVPHVALRLCWQAETVDAVADAAAAMLARHGYRRACIVGHSYGTFVASRICQLHPQLVHSVCLLDPVTMMTCYPQLLSNFIYKEASAANFTTAAGAVDLLRFLCSRDLTISQAFCRKFLWSELMLWPQDLPRRSLVVLSGCDDLVPSELVMAQLKLAGHPAKVMHHPDLGHGGILLAPQWQAQFAGRGGHQLVAGFLAGALFVTLLLMLTSEGCRGPACLIERFQPLSARPQPLGEVQRPRPQWQQAAAQQQQQGRQQPGPPEQPAAQPSQEVGAPEQQLPSSQAVADEGTAPHQPFTVQDEQPSKQQEQAPAAAAKQQQPQQPQQEQQAGAAPAPADPAPLPWAPVLSSDQLKRGLSFYGTGRRMERLVAKLMAGQPVTAVTIGGSVTWGAGATSRTVTSYPARFFEFINATFPHKDHALLNKAISATNAGTFATCTERLVPAESDLVVVEFTFNEAPSLHYTTPNRRSVEALLRKLLRMPHSPAVIVLHHYGWYHSAGDGITAGLFYRDAETHLSTMAQYYDMPSPSLRNAVYQEMQADIAPFKYTKIHVAGMMAGGKEVPQAAEAERGRYFYNDVIHPADHGHQALAELLAGVIRTAARNVAAAGGPAAVLDGSSSSGSGGSSDSGGSGQGQQAQQEQQKVLLPPPMIPGNADQATTLCAMQEEFKGVAAAMEGFAWKAERPNKTTFIEQKWGYRSEALGNWIELQVSTKVPGNNDQVLVLLGYLRSYTGMGLAKVTCASGCTCRPSWVDGFWDSPTSLTQMHAFKVSQHPRCRLRIAITGRPPGDKGLAALRAALQKAPPGATYSVGHKFQLNGVMVATSEPALWGYPQQAGDLMQAVG
ncbi:expressed protein isoform A [Chlorella sorokiniana]|uniref:Expressed protein isoform A n=1 Tax=Chlorella sorokiniana TaxID=3076 RepID=A0A2P6U2D1_CHLSO|nr:expressed protein isoform A [Chlorella sorokiniana]|eukprot:PRW60464.1 expressed protein isoform A [Chlorella sorokiniana]